MNPNILPSNRATVVGAINPASQGAGTVSTGWIDMSDYGSLLAIAQFGAFGSDASADVSVEQADTDAGGNAKAVEGKGAAGVDDDGSQVIVDVFEEDLDINGGFRYVRVSIEVETAASLVAGVVLGFDARYQPGEHAESVVS